MIGMIMKNMIGDIMCVDYRNPISSFSSTYSQAFVSDFSVNSELRKIVGNTFDLCWSYNPNLQNKNHIQNIMQKFLIITFLSLLGLQASLSAGEGWTTDFKAAQAQAKAEGKPLFLEFTGSDWCPPCMALHKNVFSQAAFKDYAKESLVWVQLDFPRSKTQSAQLKAQNVALRDQFNVPGYPTVLILDSDGEMIGKTGYRRGGAESYVAHVKEIIASVE